MRKQLWWAAGVRMGVGSMFLFDPRAGRARRARARDRLRKNARQAAGLVESGVRDLSHRSAGMVARARDRLRSGEPEDDAVIEERVRAELGRVVAHPHAVDVVSLDGNVRLLGRVSPTEHEDLVRAVAEVRGVCCVTDQLLEYDGEGEREREGRRARRWPPYRRLLAGGAGAGLLWAGARRGSLLGWAVAGAGALLAARSVTDRDLRDLMGVGADRRGFEIRKTLHVRAPVADVFALWSDLPAFPRFMTHLRQVIQHGPGRYHFRVGVFSWDAEVVALEPDHLIAWRSVPGAQVDNAGSVHFASEPDGRTRVDIHLAYKPPAGALGQGLAGLLGLSPKRQLEDDLLRFKSLVEEGKARGRDHAVTFDEIAADGRQHPPLSAAKPRS